MRKLAVAALTIMALLLPHAETAALSTNVTVNVEGTSVEGFVDEAGRTLVPARFVAEALRATVGWEPATQTVTITQTPTVISLSIGSKHAQVNGRDVELDSSAAISPEGRTMVPLRFIAEALGQKVLWDGETRTVLLKDAALSERPARANQVGNSMTNLEKGGWAARQGDWIFFTNVADSGRLYRMRLDGSGIRRLTEDAFVSSINVVGDWVYYISADHGAYTIKKVKLDGTEGASLLPGKARDLLVAGGRVFYIDMSDDNHIYRMKTDGSGRTRLNDLYSQGLLADGDWLYYRGRENGIDWLYRVGMNGADGGQVARENPYGLFLVGGVFYYQRIVDWQDKYISLIRNEQDWTDSTTVVERFPSYWVVNDDQWFYYADGDAMGGPLIRMRADGSAKQQLAPDKAARISLLGDWLLYENTENGRAIYRIKTDGTGKARLEGTVWREVP